MDGSPCSPPRLPSPRCRLPDRGRAVRSLLFRGLGASIDSHDVVIRVNDAPTVEVPANDIAIQDRQTQDDMVFLVPKEGGGYEDAAGSGIALEFDDVDDSSLDLEIAGLDDYKGTFAFTASGGLEGTAKLADHLTAEAHLVTIRAKDDGNSDGSSPLSASDELTVYIGLNASKDTGLVGETDYTLTGSDVADDLIDTQGVGNFAMKGSTVTLNLGDGKNTFINTIPSSSSYLI